MERTTSCVRVQDCNNSMEDTLLVPVKELPDLGTCYKGELNENALLNKVATVAPKTTRVVCSLIY